MGSFTPKPKLHDEKQSAEKNPGPQRPPGYHAEAIEPKGGKQGHGLRMSGHHKGA
jgi:hypothetical protein